ncbi:zinc metalloproteinase-disintegrin-like batroxstatin-2 [Xenopus laevis]|uniref:Zinc metalloproteinase-disintegrin-like batroxstatin-2 n=1 Tax=Xenopus laevis TaxID=8355 RepID=A0A8J0UUT5_XENLA|nr:zinc metalloproteinase-disintegrin-like batroxstatin-2 [Xenopus laevis]
MLQAVLPTALLLSTLFSGHILAFDRIPPGHKYEVVFPRKLHFQHKRDTQSKYPNTVQYEVQLEGEPLVLKLEKTEDLISEDYTETQYLPDGTPKETSPEIQDHCYYQGGVENDSSSLVSISTCNGLSGIIQTRGRRYLIEPLKQTDSEEHAVFPYQAQESTPRTCGVTNTTYMEGNFSKTSFSTNNEERKEFLKSKKFIQLYMVADNSMFNKYSRSTENVRRRIFEIVNFVNVVYKQMNIFVALTGIEVWDRTDKFTVVSSANEDLRMFSEWRKNDLLPRKAHDNAQFITNTDFDGATVGLAYVGTLCSSTLSTGVIQDHSQQSISIGATVAHEMGHNLGMNHDEEPHCTCSSGSCIMEPSLSFNTPREFSLCSHQNYQDFILQKMPLCMTDKPQKTEIQTPPLCGNKFTELGEECDCGTVEECTNPCCDAFTCKLKSEAQCAEGQCCSKCQWTKAGTVCRDSKGDCDLTEMCDGQSAECPSDRFRVNGFPCINGEGYCYNGICPTLQGMCSVLWGPDSVVADDSCFNYNLRGLSYAFCLDSRGNNIPCKPRDIKCGTLHCSGGSERPISGGYYTIGECKTTWSPTFIALNGTKCGENMVCYRGECTSTESAFGSSDCDSKCPKNMVCDHENQCQCEKGWAPPDCSTNTSTNRIIIAVVALCVAIIFILLVVWFKWSKHRKQRSSHTRITGAVNPAFIVREKPRGPAGSNAATPQRPMNAPPPQPLYPPANFQRPMNAPPPQPLYPPANLQAFQRPVNAPPPLPTSKPVFPSVPPQAWKPNYRN